MNRIGFLLMLLALARVAMAVTILPIGEMRKSVKSGATVTIQGTVTGLGNYYANLHDGTGGVPVYHNRLVLCKTGEVLRVTGTLERRNQSPLILVKQCEHVGSNPEAAKPVELSPTELLSAKGLDYRSISVRGVVADAFRDELDPEWTFLFFSPLNAHAAAAVYDPAQKIVPSSLIDAEVVVTGNYNAEETNGRPHLGPHVSTFFTDSIQTLSVPNADPFRSDAFSISESGGDQNGHRRCLAGTVLATWNGNSFFLKTENDFRVRIHLMPGTPLPRVGTRVSVAGFPCHSIFFTEFGNAIWRTEDATAHTTELPTDVSPVDLLNDRKNQRRIRYQMDGHLIRIQGKVLSISPADKSRQGCFLLCGNETIKVEANEFPAPEVNSEVKVTGICRFSGDECDGPAGIRLNGFSILPRTSDDIEVTRNPPWWTPARAVIAAGILIALILAALIWNFILQKLVARKGRELARESLAHLKAELRTDERTSLAVELHDTIAQNLTGVSMQMEGVDEAHRIGSPRLGELIGKARHALDSCRTELRNCLWDLRNDAFDSDDISATVRKAIAPHLGSASAGVKLDLQRSRISDSTFHAILCIIRELVINAVRHGAATQIEIRGEMAETELKITVRDNGRGFDPSSRPGPTEGHFGLLGIQERLDRLGGTLGISSTPGHGAEFTIILES